MSQNAAASSRLTRRERLRIKRAAEPKYRKRGLKRRGGGYVSWVEPPQEYRGSTYQTAGFYPFAAPGAIPNVGIPIGPRLDSNKTACFDVMTWFRHQIILNPSSFTLGLPALGKSTLGRRTVIGLAADDVTSLILGDLKPDYVDTITKLEGGQIIGLGRGRGSLNVLDLGALDQAAQRLEQAGYITEARKLREDGHARRLTLLGALLSLIRGGPLTETETAVLSAALRVLSERHSPADPPLLPHLNHLLEDPPESVRLPTLDRGDLKVFREIVNPLQRTLLALMDGPLGQVFAKPTTTRINMDASAVCMDVSSMYGKEPALEAAVLLATWAEGFSAVEAAHALADVGLERQRNFYVMLDELWRTMRAGANMTDAADGITRLNRNEGVGQSMISHSLADMRALNSAADIEKARGFLERAGVKILFGLPPHELDEVHEVIRLSSAEYNMITSWGSPESLSAAEGADPAGRGCFMIKVGDRPGIPVRLQLTEAEIATQIHNTNKRWQLTNDPVIGGTVIDLSSLRPPVFDLSTLASPKTSTTLPSAPEPLSVATDTLPAVLDLRDTIDAPVAVAAAATPGATSSNGDDGFWFDFDAPVVSALPSAPEPFTSGGQED